MSYNSRTCVILGDVSERSVIDRVCIGISKVFIKSSEIPRSQGREVMGMVIPLLVQATNTHLDIRNLRSVR